MAEELYDHDENEHENIPRSSLSGELGSPSITWLDWLTATTDGGTLPIDELAGDDSPAPIPESSSGWYPEPGTEATARREVGREASDSGVEIDEHPTTPLEPLDPFKATSLPRQEGPTLMPPESSLFERRYGREPWQLATPETSVPLPPGPLRPIHLVQPSSRPGQDQQGTDSYAWQEGTNRSTTFQTGASRKARRSTIDAFAYFHADLQLRRSQDENRTGRHWPGNGIPYPGNPHEAMFFDQLAIALGEVDPQLLARESALRYVRASRLPKEDDLGPTDIYAIFYYGLGLSLRPLDCAGLPYVLATYSRLLHEVYLDWTLLSDPPFGRATLDHTAWRRAVDSSQLARILLAWCVATHLAENYDVPLLLGFSGYAMAQGQEWTALPMRGPTLSPVGVAGDVLNRYRKTIVAFANLLAPQERLWQQISMLKLGIHMGDPEWRARVRAICSLEGSGGSWRQNEVTTGHLMPGGFWYPKDMDPVEQLISILAERNNCPPSLIEWQLDGKSGILDWDTWSMQLLRDVPALQQRYIDVERHFHTGGSKREGFWSTMGPMLDMQPPPLRLSF